MTDRTDSVTEQSMYVYVCTWVLNLIVHVFAGIRLRFVSRCFVSIRRGTAVHHGDERG